MRQYCSLWDIAYCGKGLVLYASLKQHSSEPFCLHVLAMDDKTYQVLDELAAPDITIYRLSTFEGTMGLRGIRENRTWQEFCWLSASNFMEYLLPSVDGITYLDADTFFFSDPEQIFNEIGERSIAITPHRFPPERKHMEANGKFNVGLVYARNDESGRKCIAKWAGQCRERCSAKVGCGDQKYLDEWVELYGADLCIIGNIGVNVAPWNVSNWAVTEGPFVDGVPVVFYHVHELTDTRDEIRLTNYHLRQQDIDFIYEPYLRAYAAAKAHIAVIDERLSQRQAAMQLQSERA